MRTHLETRRKKSKTFDRYLTSRQPNRSRRLTECASGRPGEYLFCTRFMGERKQTKRVPMKREILRMKGEKERRRGIKRNNSLVSLIGLLRTSRNQWTLVPFRYGSGLITDGKEVLRGVRQAIRHNQSSPLDHTILTIWSNSLWMYFLGTDRVPTYNL